MTSSRVRRSTARSSAVGIRRVHYSETEMLHECRLKAGGKAGLLRVRCERPFLNRTEHPLVRPSRTASEAEIQTEILPDSRLVWTKQCALLGLANPESQTFTTACSGQSASSLSQWMPVLGRVRSALLSGCFGVRDDL